MKKELGKRIKTYLKKYFKKKVKRIRKALELIEANRIFLIKNSYLTIPTYLIKGENNYYVTIKNLWCSCFGFTSLIINDKIKPCYHLIACSIINEKNIPVITMQKEKVLQICFTSITKLIKK